MIYCYVEFTRNVPLLLQILLWYGIIRSLPAEARSRRSQPISGVFLVQPRFLRSRVRSSEPAFWAVVALPFMSRPGRCRDRIQDRWARKGQEADRRNLSCVFSISLAVVVGLPLAVVLPRGHAGGSLDLPELKGFNFKGGLTVRPEFHGAVVCALSDLYRGLHRGDRARRHSQSVSHGQTEAALRARPEAGSWTIRLVILPQALRVIVPPLISQYLNVTKNSSLAIAVGYMDIVATIGGISLNQTGRALRMHVDRAQPLSGLLAVHVSAVMNWYNKRVALVER